MQFFTIKSDVYITSNCPTPTPTQLSRGWLVAGSAGKMTLSCSHREDGNCMDAATAGSARDKASESKF